MSTYTHSHQAYYERNREMVCAKERARIEIIKEDPEALERYQQRKRTYYLKNKDSARASKRRYDERNRERNRARHNERRRRDREDALAAYGGACACCGEAAFEFLSIDHVNGGGAKHRKSLTSSQRREFCRYLKEIGYPPEYRVLCHNCNMAIGIYGHCPHDSKSSSLRAVA